MAVCPIFQYIFHHLQVMYQYRGMEMTSDSLSKYLTAQTRNNICVVKASHLTTGNCVYFLHPNGKVSLPQPVGPGKNVMAQLQSSTKSKLR